MTVTECFLQGKDNIVVIGDLIIDRTYYVKVNRISPEAPIPIAKIKHRNPFDTPGGAGLAVAYAKNVKEFNTVLCTATTISNERLLTSNGIRVFNFLANDPENDSVIKTRYIDEDSGYQLLRVDNDLVASRPKIDYDDLFLFIESHADQIKGIVMLDYCKGIFNSVTSAFLKQVKKLKIPTYVDSRSEDLSRFKGVDYLKLNTREYVAALENNFNNELPTIAGLCDRLEISNLIITHGKEGAVYFNRAHLHTFNYEPDLNKYSGTPDVTGCGDVFDISFSNSVFVKNDNELDALKNAVDAATEYAYNNIEDRLC